jgi:hypothetical protein
MDCIENTLYRTVRILACEFVSAGTCVPSLCPEKALFIEAPLCRSQRFTNGQLQEMYLEFWWGSPVLNDNMEYQ